MQFRRCCGPRSGKKPRPRYWAGFKFGRKRAADATGIIWHYDIGSALTTINFGLNLWAHRNSVIHSGDPWRQPGGTFGFFASCPGPHSAFEDDFAAMCLDRDAVCVEQSAAP